jgi:hypothetical protein
MSEARDFALARLAVTRVSLQAAIEAVDETTAYFVMPEDDKTGKQREELLDTAAEALGEATRALEAAQEALDDDEFDPEEGEEEEEEDEDDDDEEEEEDEEDEDDDAEVRTRNAPPRRAGVRKKK